MAATTSTIDYALKRLYPSQRIENLVYQDNPLFAMVKKAPGFGGSAKAVVVRHRDTLGRSATFTQAQSAIGNASGVQFLVTRVKDYQLFSIDTEAILATQGDKAAFLSGLDTEVSSAMNNMGRSLAIAMYGSGTGALGVVTVSTVTWTLQDINQITNFEVGMKLVVAATETGNLRNSGTGQTITAINRDTGVITVDANTDSAVTGDYVFVKGDHAATYSAAEKMSGLEAWNPASAPGATAFFGVDRSSDPSRLGGLRIDISALNPEEGLITALHSLAREGGRPSHLFLNYIDSKNIHLALGSKAEMAYTSVGQVGFSTIKVTGPKGDVLIVPDQNAPAAVGRLLTLSSWELGHAGELINKLAEDGSMISRVYNADQFEGRLAFYGNLSCNAPGHNARLVLPS